MASVMAIESEVFGSCAGEINVSVEIEKRGAWLCCGWIHLGFILTLKVAQYLLCRWAMVPGNGWDLRLVEGG